jgi:phosphoglycerate kinase
MKKKTIEDVEVAGRRVLLRADFNVPLDAQGAIADDRRVRATLPTICSVMRRGGRLILMSHLGRPKTQEDRARLSLRPVAARLQELLGSNVLFVGGVIGEEVRDKADRLQDGQILMLENLRFHPGEAAGDTDLARALAALGEVYCNDAFGACHRADASLVGLPRAMQGRPRVAGLLLAKEVRILTELMIEPQRPFVAVLGGAKISDKIGAVRRLAEVCDRVLIGGAMANTFALAQGGKVGKSLAEPAQASVAREILEKAPGKVVLPVDVCCSASLSPGLTPQVFAFGGVPEGLAAYDIGPRTVEQFAQALRSARTLFWNGPLGVFEVPPFDAGTRAVAQAVAAAGGRSVVGGGDTAAALDRLGLADPMFHVSTGGGASLALIAGERLQALDVLDEA